MKKNVDFYLLIVDNVSTVDAQDRILKEPQNENLHRRRSFKSSLQRPQHAQIKNRSSCYRIRHEGHTKICVDSQSRRRFNLENSEKHLVNQSGASAPLLETKNGFKNYCSWSNR